MLVVAGRLVVEAVPAVVLVLLVLLVLLVPFVPVVPVVPEPPLGVEVLVAPELPDAPLDPVVPLVPDTPLALKVDAGCDPVGGTGTVPSFQLLNMMDPVPLLVRKTSMTG